MQAGIVITWGRPVPDRERGAAETVRAMEEYAAGLAKQNTITNVFRYETAIGHYETLAGFIVLEGEHDKLLPLLATEEWRYFTELFKASYLNPQVAIMWGTDEATLRQVTEDRERALNAAL